MSNTIAVTLLLDRSGSMEACRSDALGAVNGYLRQLREDRAVETSLSLLLFDSESIDVVRRDEPVATVQDLAAAAFQPRGATPLLDAVAQAVAVLEQSGRPNSRRILVIMTDGYENASREHTHQSIARLLERKQKEDGWLVVYLGAGHDAWDQASRIGVVQAFSADFSMEQSGDVADALHAVSSRFSCGIDVGAGFTDRERRAMLSVADPDAGQPAAAEQRDLDEVKRRLDVFTET